MPARRAFIHIAHADVAQNAINDQAQTRGNFELGVFATHTGGEDCRIATPNARANHQRVAGDPKRVRLDTHDELAVEVRGSRKRVSIDDVLVTNDRDRGSTEPRLRLALGTPDHAIRAPSADRELRRTRAVLGHQPGRPFSDLPARFVGQAEFDRKVERARTNSTCLASEKAAGPGERGLACRLRRLVLSRSAGSERQRSQENAKQPSGVLSQATHDSPIARPAARVSSVSTR